MPISRIILRLEVTTEQQLIALSYCANDCEAGICRLKQSYATVTSTTAAAVKLSKESSLLYVGRRQYCKISVETFCFQAASFTMAHDNTHESCSELQHSDNLPSNMSHELLENLRVTDTDEAQAKRETAARRTLVKDTKGCAASSLKPSSRASTPVRFFSGNPTVETTEGIIHIFKEDQLCARNDEPAVSDMLCMLNVPAMLGTQDLLQFVAPSDPWLEQIKIIRDNTPNQYMVLLKFRSQKHAVEFYRAFSNQPFNSIESDICHLAYVAKVETIRSSEGGGSAIPGATELPVCPVCLDRMDESVDGILTILCNHSFHGSCLANWNDMTCPVCRYVQTPVAVADNRCFVCSASENLWICLICGIVGCGRYDGGHAYLHFQETNHNYCMQLGSNRVWDYAGDNYVHRLIQNKGDGKLVQVDEGGNVIQDEKLDSITLEYTYLLTSQLESQRLYFEDKIQQVEVQVAGQLEQSEAKMKKTLEEYEKRDQLLAVLTKEKQSIEKKCSQFQTKVTKLSAELNEEHEMNKCLSENQTRWQSKVKDLEEKLALKEAENKDLQDQLRDLMFYIDAQQKLEASADVSHEELQEGQIVIGPSPTTSSGKKSRKKGR